MATMRQSWVLCESCRYHRAVKSKGSICKVCRQRAAQPAAAPSRQPGLLTPDEQATLLDIVRQYHAGHAAPHNAIAWVYGLVANSALNDGSL